MHEIIDIIPVGAFQCNCIILADPQSKEAIVIDPGDQVTDILARIRKLDLKVKSILHTHTHIDHIGGTTALQKETNARVLLHAEDLFLYEQMAMQGAFLGLHPNQVQNPVPPDEFLKDGQEIQAGSISGTVLHTPGHTPGSCGFYFPKLESGLLIPGDTLFAGSVGRTDLWGGDYDLEIQSIKKKYLSLPDETIVIPGHGPNTSIGREKRMNPFLN
ncbi:MAG: MBL fold metallo-hydrolase [Deltaproteobacteria bacterium]|nr:MBL fold metallo-hydrolase [Deltaproteobacteria bacterium]